MLSYEGIFFEGDMVELIHSLETKKLDKVLDEIHCTFRYHPTNDEIFNDIVGKTFEVYLIGYANDGQSSGFEVLLPEELKAYYINYENPGLPALRIPHITASLAEGVTPSNTKNLNFKPLEKPVKLVGRFGYWIKDENEEYLSYEPYQKMSKI